MSTTITIAARFNGPPGSGNGGYCCGLLARSITGAARVRLHVPPPLERPLQIVTGDDGTLQMRDGETLVGTAAPADMALEIPAPPTVAQARAASGRYPGFEHHLYPHCFVCGPQRRAGDGLCIFPGPVADWNLLACVWQPDADLLDDTGHVRPEIVWAALDCPGYFGIAGPEPLRALLGELTARIYRPLPGDDTLVVFCWPLGHDGRKYYGASAIADAHGDVLACARSTWIQLKD